MPNEKREQIIYEDEIFNFLRQSHITKKNISRLRKLAVSPYERIAKMAGIVLEVVKVKPYKKKRLKELAEKRRDLLHKLECTGLIMAHQM